MSANPFARMALRARAEGLMADLHAAQTKRRQALDDAATYHDHPGFIEALLDELSQPHMRDAFIRQCQDIIEGHETANRDFVRAVQRVAIEFFGEPI